MSTFEAAKETAGAIEDGSKADALREIAKAQAEAGEKCLEAAKESRGD
ncbi:MAG: hypothetical protein IPL01_19775 [Acidobacteria bacterium]|nr:hypothetical protein [Acidobacteriota bacterium]